jgi:tape measure domain-containing protein
MAGTVSAGTIVYEVDMDTAGILQGRRDIDAALNGLNGSMGRLEAGLNRTERSLSSIEGTMSSLTGVAKALIAALSVQQVGAYAQAWQDLSNKLANAVRDSVPPFETLADVTERVFDISQKTRSGLDATATLYARLERSTRSYGVSVEDITRLTTIINQGFVVSGSTAEEASNAIIQLAQGLASGALRGDEFNSVNEQGNRLMIALADSMNVSIGALRNMAAEGKLTTDVIVNGLLSQGDKIGQEFAKTTATISQSLEIANNNITKFFGENATVKTGVKIFSDSVISLSENLDVLSTTLTIVAGVMGARYVGALTMATSAKIADIAASRQQVVADNQTAQAALVAANSVQRKALADKEAALSSLALAQAEYNVAKGSAAEMLAMDALVAAKTRATTASLLLLRLKLPRLLHRPVRRQLLVQRQLVSEWLVVRLLS